MDYTYLNTGGLYLFYYEEKAHLFGNYIFGIGIYALMRNLLDDFKFRMVTHLLLPLGRNQAYSLRGIAILFLLLIFLSFF